MCHEGRINRPSFFHYPFAVSNRNFQFDIFGISCCLPKQVGLLMIGSSELFLLDEKRVIIFGGVVWLGHISLERNQKKTLEDKSFHFTLTFHFVEM